MAYICMDPFFEIIESYQPTARDKVVRFGARTHADVEPIVTLLRGQLTIDNLNYTSLSQYHPTRSPLSELIRSATVKINNVPRTAPSPICAGF